MKPFPAHQSPGLYYVCVYIYMYTHKYLTNILFVPLATLCVCVCGTNPGRKTNLRMIPGNFYVLFVHRVQDVLYFNCYSINRSFSHVSNQCFSAEGIGLFTQVPTSRLHGWCLLCFSLSFVLQHPAFEFTVCTNRFVVYLYMHVNLRFCLHKESFFFLSNV